MKVYSRYVLVDTNQVALYVEHYDRATYEILYKTYGNSGSGTVFRGSAARCREMMDLIVKAEQNSERAVILSEE